VPVAVFLVGVKEPNGFLIFGVVGVVGVLGVVGVVTG